MGHPLAEDPDALECHGDIHHPALTGGVVAWLTRVNIWYGAARQLLLAALAAGVTYAVGRAIGASVT